MRAVRNKFLSAGRQGKTAFPVETFLTADSCQLPVRNIFPDGFLLIPDGLRPTGKFAALVRTIFLFSVFAWLK
jgi:hypothetical protein